MSEKYVTPAGSRTRTVYSPKVNDDGTIDLIPSGKEDWYGLIQSYKDSVDVHCILARCANGDMSALNKVQGFYADATKFPKTHAEMLQIMIDARNNFDKMPSEVKQKFDNDFNKFFSTMDKPEWFEKMGIKKKEDVTVIPVEQPVESEVKE